ncbi:MAG: efflux transporter outer membrane subunit [Pantoea sp. Morm]|uniref:efflux transporter outer membrane subunit n=1 Tax=Pantoea sp. Morm TaxID=2601250 RepID=UPI001D6DC663|nr:efflux transporter outer membrane subunit [Pantoea sp. Morm]
MKISAFNHHAALLLACSILAGCQLQPDYKKPDVRVPDQWNHQFSAQSSENAVGEGDFYKDRNLRVIIGLSLRNNMDLKEAALNLRKAQELYGIERLSILPSVNASFSQTSAHEPAGLLDTVDTGALTYHQFDAKLVSASWELDFWGRLRSMKDSALNNYLATDATARALRLSITAQAASSYLTFLADKENLRLAERKSANLRQMQSMQAAAWRLGDVSQETLLSQDTALRRQQQDVAALRASVQKDYDALQLLLGGDPPLRLMENVAFTDLADFPPLQPDLPSTVLQKRPDVAAAEFRMRQANADIGAARAAFFPTISLTASGGSSSAALGDLFSAGTAAWSFSPNINLPIFNNGRNMANLHAAEISQQIAAADYEKVIKQAFRDTSDAMAERQAGRSRYEESVSLSANRTEMLKMTKLSAQAGDRSSFDCLDAENSLLDARRESNEERLHLFLQDIQLFQALGGNVNSN